MTTRAAAQAAQERHSALVLEIDADSCTNTFGVSPCIAGRVQAAQTAQAGTAKSLTLSATASAVADAYANMAVRITGGAGAGQERRVVMSRKNKLSYSNSFSASVWANKNTTLLPGQLDPFGGTNGWKYSIGAVQGYIDHLNQPIAQDELTFYAKADSTGWALMTFQAYGNTETAWFNLLTGTLGSIGSNLTASIVPAGNGFYKCSARKRVATASAFCIFAPTLSDGITDNQNCSMFAYVAHLSKTTGDEPMITLANPAVGIAVQNWSSNLVLNSATAQSAYNFAYEQSMSGDLVTATGNVSNPYGGQYISIAAPVGGMTFTFSVDLWADVGQPLTGYSMFLYDGSVTYILEVAKTITNARTRYSISYTVPAGATSTQIFCRIDQRHGFVAGNNFHVANLQVEVGSVATPYIATTTAIAALPDATSVYDLIDRPNGCYNTYGTCKDKAHYVKGVQTFKFCSRGMAIPAGEPLRPYIAAHAFTPTEIPVGGGLAARSQTTLTMADEVCSDVEADQYAAVRSSPASGTFWTRFIARNYNIQGRFARVRKGYITNPFDWAVFQNELYMIESIIGPDSSGNVQIVLADITKTLDKNMLPVATSGKLAAALKAIEYQGTVVSADATHATLDAKASAVDGYYVGMEIYLTQNTGAGQRRVISAYVGATRVATVAAWTVVPDNTSTYQISALNVNLGTGNGVQYADPVATGLPQYMRLGKEVVRYTSIAGDVLSWPDSTYRAQFGTAAADAKIGDSVQLCFAPVAQSVTAVIHRLANAAGIADAYIDLAGLAAEDTSWYGTPAIITACIHTPEKASALLNELLATINLCAWWDVVAQQIKFKADMPQLASTVVAITPSETISKSLQVTPLDSLRISRSFMAFAPFSATENMTQSTNFSIIDGKIDANAESPAEYNNVISEQRYSRWMSAANALFVAGLVSRRVSRLRDAPFKLAFSLDPRNEVHLGDLIDVSSRKKTDSTGAPLVTRMRVTKYLDNQNIDIEAISTNFVNRYAFIAPNGYPNYAVANVDQRQYAFIAANTEYMSDGSNAYLIS